MTTQATQKRYAGIATKARRRRLLQRDGAACWWCSSPFTDEDPPTIDHLVPHRAGGSSDDDNLVLACGPCNNHRERDHCETCGGRVRRWGSAVWVSRRWLFHDRCSPI